MAKRTTPQIVIGLLIAILLGIAVSLAGSDGGHRVGAIPLFALCGLIAFAINWLAFIPSALTQSEHFYDLVGGISYITITTIAVFFASPLDFRATLVAGMVIVWSLRLATFLFLRISKAGGDSRFDEIKSQPLRFFLAWTLQGLWVLLTAAAALAIITGGTRLPLGVVGVTGIVIWGFGFLVEIVSDQQKARFKQDPNNKGKFIQSGLWAWSRHPNYFGEIVIWIGMAIVAIPVLTGWQWVTLISPIFVILLLTKVSGVPLLEEKADQRWGGQADYESYKARTPVLFPRSPSA